MHHPDQPSQSFRPGTEDTISVVPIDQEFDGPIECHRAALLLG